MGGGQLGILKKNIFIFKTRQNMVKKFRQFTKLGPFSTFQLFKLSKLCYHFLSSFENEIFFLYPQLSPAQHLPEFINQSILPKKIDVSVCFQKKEKKCKTEMQKRVPEILVTFIIFLIIYRNFNLFGKIDWSMHSKRRWAGDS